MIHRNQSTIFLRNDAWILAKVRIKDMVIGLPFPVLNRPLLLKCPTLKIQDHVIYHIYINECLCDLILKVSGLAIHLRKHILFDQGYY